MPVSHSSDPSLNPAQAIRLRTGIPLSASAWCAEEDLGVIDSYSKKAMDSENREKFEGEELVQELREALEVFVEAVSQDPSIGERYVTGEITEFKDEYDRTFEAGLALEPLLQRLHGAKIKFGQIDSVIEGEEVDLSVSEHTLLEIRSPRRRYEVEHSIATVRGHSVENRVIGWAACLDLEFEDAPGVKIRTPIGPGSDIEIMSMPESA